MNKIIKNTPEQLEKINKDKQTASGLISNVFLQLKELGVVIDIPRHGHIVLNPVDFEFTHKDEVYVLDYRVQL